MEGRERWRLVPMTFDLQHGHAIDGPRLALLALLEAIHLQHRPPLEGLDLPAVGRRRQN